MHSIEKYLEKRGIPDSKENYGEVERVYKAQTKLERTSSIS